MKIYINRNFVEGPWGGGNACVRMLYENAPKRGFSIEKPENITLKRKEPTYAPYGKWRFLTEYSHTMSDDIDVFFCIDPRVGDAAKGEMRYCDFMANKKNKSSLSIPLLVYRVNECDARNGGVNHIDRDVREMISQSDLVIFISEWLRDYHMKGDGYLRPPVQLKDNARVEVIPNGHLPHFKPGKKRDDGICHIVTHHWSPNEMKGKNEYCAIAKWAQSHKEFDFTYIGRASYENELRDCGAKIIPPLYGVELGDLLGTFDCYISGSRFDPGPNHVSEALGCKLPVWVSSECGGGVEMAGVDHSYSSIEELIDILESSRWKTPNTTTSETWDVTIKRYFDLIEETMAA